MIDVLVHKTKYQLFKAITIHGHADSAPHGQDLVCAAVSAIAVGTLNALGHSPNLVLMNKVGHIEIQIVNPITERETTILETMLVQLKTIQASHPKYIHIKQRKEK